MKNLDAAKQISNIHIDVTFSEKGQAFPDISESNIEIYNFFSLTWHRLNAVHKHISDLTSVCQNVLPTLSIKVMHRRKLWDYFFFVCLFVYKIT